MTAPLDNEKIWNLYSSGGIGFTGALALAAGVKCLNGNYTLPDAPEKLCAAMLVLGEDIFTYLGSEDHQDQVQYFARSGAYHRIQKAVEALYPEESGHITDPWLGESFSDIYKDRNGFRPTGYTAKQMREWFERDAEEQRTEVEA